MSVTQRRLRKAAAVALVAVTALGAVAACSKKKDDTADSTGGQITLTVDTFGKFGYEDLYKAYEASHTNIKIEPRVIDKLGDYTPKLTQYLAAGSGAGDIVALEEGIIGQFKANPTQFVDLKPYVGDLSAEYIPYKWQNGLSSDGSKVIGLPTDEGGMAMCYRADLIKAAGLGDNRDAVSANWPTWDAFLATAQKYKAKTGKPLLDSTTTAFSAVMFQLGGDLFYDKSNNYVAGTSTTVKSAWDTAVKLIEGGASAKLATWSNDWVAGFKNGTFAATLCPSWMTGVIKGNAGDEGKGKWDIASVPGNGGNWGGSWLAVPTQSKHPKEAAELAKFLTSAESQVAAFKAAGPLPSNLKALDDPSFQAVTDDYFSGAPTGKIFGAGAKALQPVYLGPVHASIKEQAFEPQLQAIEQGKVKPADGFAKAVADGEKLAKS